MKNIKNIYTCLFLSLGMLFMACEDEETDGVSFVTSYPTFELEGGSIISIVSGGSFTDPGVTATEDGKQLEVSVSGQVDTSTPGLYTLTYSATNSDGFDGTASRLIVVTAEDVSGTDLSGTYQRGATTTTFTKVVDGYYTSSNLWGDGNGVSGGFIHTGGTNILVPVQASKYGRFHGAGQLTGDGMSMSFTLLDPPNTGITLNRVYVKQ